MGTSLTRQERAVEVGQQTFQGEEAQEFIYFDILRNGSLKVRIVR